MTLSPGLEKNYTLERSSNIFPGTTCMSGCLENCQKSIQKSWCSQIQGTISNFLLTYGTDLSSCFYTFQDLVSWIGEHWDFGMYFLQFSRHLDILVIPGKLLEPCSNVQFFSNPGDNVMISAEISCSQDLRVQHTLFDLVGGGFVINRTYAVQFKCQCQTFSQSWFYS